jgi:hypothetical protein
MRLVVVVMLAGCLAERPVTVDATSIDVPRGAGIDVVMTSDGAPVPADEIAWLVDDTTLVDISVSADATLHVTGVREGDTTVYVGAHGQSFALPTHVAPPAIVQLWVEPARVTTDIGSAVPVAAKAMDTTSAISDVTARASWTVTDPAIARFGPDMMIHGSSSGITTLDVAIGSAATSVPITVQ